MFEHLNSQPSDKIMELMAQYAEDTSCLLYTSTLPTRDDV